MSLEIRKLILAKSVLLGGCWNWTGNINYQGYGRFSQNSAHRMSFEAFKGKIADGLEIDHLCRNRACVNPDHLEAVTHIVNTRRAIMKSHCIRGHEFAIAKHWGYARRWCPQCKIIRDKAKRETSHV